MSSRQRVVVTEDKWSNGPTCPLLSPFWVRSNRALLALFVCAILLSGCVSPRLTEPAIATVQANPWQKGDTSLYFNDQNEALLISEGVPSSYFVSTKRGWELDRLHIIQAENIRSAAVNKGVWVP